ncbi:retrovirus-related pol polyprotein from transposon TNT 1-94 [Tanacetum coccineum]
MLIFSKAPLFLWAKAINTACYTQNRSLIRLRYNKTPYELMHDKKPDLSFFHVFGSLCYPTNDSEDFGKLNEKADIGIFIGYVPAKKAFKIYNRRTWKIMETIHMTFDELTTLAFEQFGSRPELYVMTSATSSSGLVPNIIPQQPCNPPKRDDWDSLFQPLFDEYFNPPTIVVSTVLVVAAPRVIEIADLLVSTSIDQDAPSSNSTSQGSSSNMRPSHTLFELIGRWTKDHPIANVIGDPSRSVFTRKQLKTDAMWCYFDAFLSFEQVENGIVELYFVRTKYQLADIFTKRFQGGKINSDRKAGYEKHVSRNAKTSDRGGRRWVPSAERVKISSTNIILETTVPQKEETFQVIIDVIKNSTCFKAFTISADVLEIFMQQFWYTIKKVLDTDSYEFLLANKKCTINAEVFRTILDICLRVEGVDFADVPDDDTAPTFLIDLGYKGLLNRHTNMFVDHMHQPWRTLTAIINKCLSGKTASNDKLQKYKIDILWGLFNKENVDYPELICEDFSYQIDHRKDKRSRRENMPYPRFTKIINHFLKQHKSLTNLNHKHYHKIKDDGIVSRLKFVRIGEDY